MSHEQAGAYAPVSHREILIGIRSPGDARTAYHPSFHATLELEFDDCEAEHETLRTYGRNLRSLSIEQATEVIDFIYAHADATVLIVHCAAGISRSVSLANAIADTIGRQAPNRTVHRRLQMAFDGRQEFIRQDWIEMDGPAAFHRLILGGPHQ